MVICAIAPIGKEFMYKSSSVHSVHAKVAGKIIKDLNKIKFKLKENEVWKLYEIDKYDPARWVADCQRFYYSKDGSLKEKRCR